MSLDIRPAVAVMVPPKPGAKPREVIVDLATVDEIIRAFCDAKTVLVSAGAALDGCRALDERRADEDAAEAVNVVDPQPEAKQEPLAEWERELLEKAAAEDAAGEWSAELAAAHPLRCGNPACEHPEGVHYMGGRADMITRHCLDEGCSCAAFSAPTALAQALDAAEDDVREPDAADGDDPAAAPDHAANFPAVPFLRAEDMLAAAEATGEPCACSHGDHGHEQPDSDDGQIGGCLVGGCGCRSYRPAARAATGSPVVPLIVPGSVIRPGDGGDLPPFAIGAAS